MAPIGPYANGPRRMFELAKQQALVRLRARYPLPTPAWAITKSYCWRRLTRSFRMPTDVAALWMAVKFVLFFEDRKSGIFGVWAALGARETIPKGGGRSPPPFGRASGAPGVAQAPKVTDFRSLTTCKLPPKGQPPRGPPKQSVRHCP